MVQYQTEMADQAREEKIAAARKRVNIILFNTALFRSKSV